MMNVMEKYEGTVKEVKDDIISFDLSEEMMEKLSIKPVSTIYDTYNYDIFDFAKSNRGICRNVVEKIKKSIKDGKFIGTIVVAELDGKFIIIDGQHRFVALKELGLPIRFMIQKGLTREEIDRIPRMMNLAQHVWKTMEFIISQANIGNESYVNLLKIFDEYNLPTATIIGAVTQFYANSCNGKAMNVIKDLLLDFPDEDVDAVENKLDSILELKTFIDDNDFHGKKDLLLNAVLCTAAYDSRFTVEKFFQALPNGTKFLALDRTNFANCVEYVTKVYNSAYKTKLRSKSIVEWNEISSYERALEYGLNPNKPKVLVQREKKALEKELIKKMKKNNQKCVA